MPRAASSRRSLADAKAPKAMAAQPRRPGSAARTAPSSDRMARCISATPRTTASANSCGSSSAAALLGEEQSQGGHQLLRIVALNRVAGLGDLDPAAIRKAGRQAFGVFVVKHVAFRAAHHQGRAADTGQPVGEPAPLLAVPLAAHRLKAPSVVFPYPIAIVLPAQIV